MSGRLFAFVGPSGVGKDSVMGGIAAQFGLGSVRRVITRPSDAGGEDFDGVSEADFDRLIAEDAFAIWWGAHGLRYGIPRREIGGPEDRLINLSRAVLAEAQQVLPGLEIILITAPREVLRARLEARGRESAAEVARRLARADQPMPDGVQYHSVDNSGALEDTVAAVAALLYPDSAAR